MRDKSEPELVKVEETADGVVLTIELDDLRLLLAFVRAAPPQDERGGHRVN